MTGRKGGRAQREKRVRGEDGRLSIWWHPLAEAHYRDKGASGLASLAVRLGIDLERVLFFLHDECGALELVDIYEGSFVYRHRDSADRLAQRYQMSSANRKDLHRPRRRGMPASIIGPDGRIYGDD